MQRRMLRHRVIQKCARLALGISANEVFLKPNHPNKYKTTETKAEINKSGKNRSSDLKSFIFNHPKV